MTPTRESAINGARDLVIETRALTKRYGDAIVAVDHLDLHEAYRSVTAPGPQEESR